MNAEKGVKPNTKKHRVTVYRSLVEYGKLKNFEDITVEGIEAYDAWLHEPYIDKRRDLDKNLSRSKTFVCHPQCNKRDELVQDTEDDGS